MKRTVSDLINLILSYYPKLRKVFRNLVSIKDIPITMTQLTALTVIDRDGSLSMSDLASELSMSNQQLTKVVDALVDFRMVERVFDENNRRKVYAKITVNGKKTINDLRAELDRKMSYMMRKFSDDELDNFYDCLAHIAGYFGYKEETPPEN